MGDGDLWVVIEHRDGELLDISKELCSQGRRIKRPSSPLVAVLVGKEVKGLTDHLGKYGVEKVYLVEGEEWERFNPEPLIDLLSRIIFEKKPSAILFGSTSLGNALAPRLALRHQGSLVTDCIDLRKQGEGWVAVKSIQRDKLNLRMLPGSGRLPLFTLQPGIFEIEEKIPAKPIEVEPFSDQTSFEKICTKIIGFIKADPRSAYLEEAELIVAGGKGLSDEKGFKHLEEMANLLGATVAGSRVAVDFGWIPYDRQIGLTGKKVTPRLLFAVGISGAFEFTIGIKDSKFIVAINKDPNAPIFKIADIGIIGDLHEILPMLNETLRAIKE
jgi:electron transfer flavoprotein alpha subunit